MPIFMIVLGFGLGGFFTFCYVYLVGLGCGMGPTGCRSSLPQLYFRHLPDPEGIIYLLCMALALLILIAGIKMRSKK